MRVSSSVKFFLILSLLPSFFIALNAYNSNNGVRRSIFPSLCSRFLLNKRCKVSSLPTTQQEVGFWIGNNAAQRLLNRITGQNPSELEPAISAVGASSTSEEDIQQPTKPKKFYIRDANFNDLSTASVILVDSFHQPSMLKPYHLIRELDRLQSNFPYGDKKHSMYVAYAEKDGSVLGFCDVDARPSKLPNAPPRPYLSDLAVDVRWRRRGIARALISACERKAMEFGYRVLYLRVKYYNHAAVLMYAGMGYEIMEDDVIGVHDDTLLLRKEFTL